MYHEDDYYPLATEAEADREYARNFGMDHPAMPWILSDRDVWYPNPFYRGPAVRHPEDEWEDEDRDSEASEFQQVAAASSPAYPFMGWDVGAIPDDDEMPF